MAEDEAKQPTFIQLRRIRAATKSATVSPEQITYQHTVLCQTSLPYRDPGAGVRVWEREQGNIALRVEAGAARDPQTRRFIEQGLPYGARPRLILAHLNREALLTGSPTIEVESSLTAFIKRLQGSNPNGKETRRFKEQLTRFSCATVRMAADISPQQSYQVDTKIVSAFELWQCDERQHVLWPAIVTLSLDYFHSLTKHAVPLDERAMGALANAPLALDVYCWLAQRLHRVNPAKPQRITWKALYEQFGQGYRHIRQFRAAFLRVLREVHAQYRGANVTADGRGIELRHSPPPVLCRYFPVIQGAKEPD